MFKTRFLWFLLSVLCHYSNIMLKVQILIIKLMLGTNILSNTVQTQFSFFHIKTLPISTDLYGHFSSIQPYKLKTIKLELNLSLLF